MSEHAYDAVVFDMDGVLVRLSGGTLFERAARDAFADLGVEEPPAEHVDTLAGVPTAAVEEGFATLGEAHDIDGAELVRRRDDRAAQHQTAAAETGGKPLYEDIDALADMDVPLGVVSNNQAGTVEGVLAAHGLADRFGAARGRAHGLEGLRRRKPDPHYLERVVAELGAERPLYVGDSGTDVLAAERAGHDAVFLRRSHREGYELPSEPAHEVADLEALLGVISGT